MKMNNILKTTALLLGSSVLLSGCIKETFPESGYATSDQTAESPFAKEGLITAMPTVLITNYIDLGEHIDFGYPGIFGATDRMVGEVFPVSGNLPGGNQYYDRWQAWLYPGNSTGLAANGTMSPFFYTNYYKFIFTANEAIDIANQSEGAEEMMGIAKTFRALCYLDLARLYDALPAKAPERPAYETELEAVKGLTVPIVREDTSMEELENNPRVSREEMFKFIFEDLNTAETLLANYTPATKNLPSLAVIYGLKARAYLWLGGFTESYAEVPTGDAAYRLAAEYRNIHGSGSILLHQASDKRHRVFFISNIGKQVRIGKRFHLNHNDIFYFRIGSVRRLILFFHCIQNVLYEDIRIPLRLLYNGAEGISHERKRKSLFSICYLCGPAVQFRKGKPGYPIHKKQYQNQIHHRR